MTTAIMNELAGIVLILAGFALPEFVGKKFFNQHLDLTILVVVVVVLVGGWLVSKGLFIHQH